MPGRPAAIVTKQALHGLGGVGKTRLAIEYAHQYAHQYSAQLFITADSPETLAPNLAALCGPLVLNLPEQNAVTDQQVAAVLRWLRTHPGWLIIIDNVDTEPAAQAVESLLDQLPSGHVLITSRLSNWSGEVEPLELDVLNRDASTMMLTERTEGRRVAAADDTLIADRIAEDLGDLALALEQAAAYIAKRRISLSRYHSLWRENEKKVRNWHDQRLMKYPRSVATTWKTSIDQLGPSGLTLLRLCSLLAPEPIPDGLFETEKAVKEFANIVTIFGGDAQGNTEEWGEVEPDFEDALAELLSYSLARRPHEDRFVFHRLVMEVTADQISGELRDKIFSTLADLLLYYAPNNPFKPPTWHIWDVLWEHFNAVWERTQNSLTTENRIEIGDNLSSYLYGKTRYRQCIKIWGMLLPAVENYYGKDSKEVSHILINLGEAMRGAGERSEDVVHLYERSLEITRKNHGPKSLKAANDLNYLGLAYSDGNKIDNAEKAYREAIEIYELFPDSPKYRVSMTLHNLSDLLYVRGEIDEAVLLSKRATDLASNIDGSPHTYYSIFLRNYSKMLFKTNKRDIALEKAKEAFDIANQMYGENHNFTSKARLYLADLLIAMDDYEQAEPLYRQMLVEKEYNLGSDSPDFALQLNEHALFLRKLKKVRDAERLLRRALAIEEKALPPDSPKIPHRLNNLTTVLVMQDKLKEAIQLNNRAWDLKSGKHDITSARILFMRIIIKLLEGKNTAQTIGKLKGLLSGEELTYQGNVTTTWDIDPVLDYVKEKIPAGSFALLQSIVSVMNKKTEMSFLDSFADWQDQKPINVD